jgi:hypothetical protein
MTAREDMRPEMGKEVKNDKCHECSVKNLEYLPAKPEKAP